MASLATWQRARRQSIACGPRRSSRPVGATIVIEAQNGPAGTARADVCVVGGGAVGITLALELASSSLHVIVLESGGSTPKPEDRSIYKVAPDATPQLDRGDARQLYFGGNTNHWFGNCRPLDGADFEQREWLPYSGWPISRDELVPYYERAQRLCGLGEFRWYDPETCRPRLEHGPLNLPGAVLETRMVQTCPVLSFADLHRQRLAAAENVQIMLETHAVRLEANSGGNRVVAVETSGAGGRRSRIEADTVVLASGGVENARLLLCSNETAPAGLGNGRDLVGRFFMEHWYFEFDLADSEHASDVRLYTSAPDRVGGFKSRQEAGDARVWAQLVLSDELMREERVPALAVWFAPVPDLPPSVRALRRLVNGVRKGARPEHPLSDLRTTVSGPRDVARFLRWKLTGRATPPALSNSEDRRLTVQLEQTPSPENRIRLSRHLDRFGQPRAELALRIDDQQRQAHSRSLRIAADELGLDGKKLARAMEQRLASGNFGYYEHHMGTTRMSTDPARGVVDGHCRVHGISNLFVAGSSVFPTGGTAAPTLTAVALAIRLADHLRSGDGAVR
jgi:choline dehydrogenase-like flavoprotein